MKSKVIALENVLPLIKDGMTIMFGGFLQTGSATNIIDAILEKNIKDLTIIANDTSFDTVGIGKLIVNKQVKKVITSYIGLNRASVAMMNSGELEVVFVPQGSLAEKIRAGGAGLGGVLTKTCLNTINAEGKDIINIDGEDFVLEKPLKADIAIIKAHTGDKAGNLIYNGTARNFNPLMATAAEIVIAEVEQIKEVGELNPNFIHTPAVYVDYVVQSVKK